MVKTKKSLVAVSIEGAKHSLCHKYRNIDETAGDEPVDGKIVVVTGSNAGIGLSVATQLAKRNAIVIMACRTLSKTEEVAQEIRKNHPNAQLVPVKLDLSTFDSVRACAAEIMEKFPHVNLLINNAGLMSVAPKIERNEAGIEKQMLTNHLGHFLFTLLLIPHLKKGAPSRIVSTGSDAWQVADLNLDDFNMEKDPSMGEMNMRPYGNSKLANFLFSRELGQRLANTGITTYCLCPGVNNTNLQSEWNGIGGRLLKTSVKLFGGTPDQGAETILYCALASELKGDSGRPYHWRMLWKEAEATLNGEEMNNLGQGLWTISENITNIKWADVVAQI